MARKDPPAVEEEAVVAVEETAPVEAAAAPPVPPVNAAAWEVTAPGEDGKASAKGVLPGGGAATVTATPTADDGNPPGYKIEWAIEGGAKGKATARGARPLSVGMELAAGAEAAAIAEAAAKSKA